MKTIELGSTVSCPVTDGEGENSFRMGTLVEMNSRYATVETNDGETFKIGKTKIEFVSGPESAKKEKDDTKGKSGLARAADYDYEPCTAASGKKSKDNNDSVAQELRGQTLDFAYTRAAEYLEKTETDLRSRYNHLNPGQQRMCLGNLIRGAK
jgi:hypothetical protein